MLTNIANYCYNINMATINISLPTKMATQLDSLKTHRGYATRSELVRELLRERLSQESNFEVFSKPSLNTVAKDLAETGKYNPEFIKSVIGGLKKSSLYADTR